MHLSNTHPEYCACLHLHSCYSRRSSRFADLSIELIDMIFQELDCMSDCVAFALTCWQCLRVADKYIRKRAEASVGTWAGDRIMCVGNIAPGNLPPQLRTEDVQNALLKDGQTISLTKHINDRFRKAALGPSLFSWDDVNKVCLFSDAELQVLYAIEAQYGIPSPQQQLLVMRNLSRRVYVSDKALRPLNEYLHHNGQERVRLASVLITHICWTETSWDGSEPSLEKGKWAGDRFDFVTEDELLKRIAKGETWTDVGKEIMKITIEI